MGLSRIARRLNDHGLTTVRGNAFTSSSVKTILSNPVYCGNIAIECVRIFNHHTGIVSREL